MTVKELITQLEKYDEDTKVVFAEYVFKAIDGYNCYCPEPRDIATIDNKMFDDSITLIVW